MATRTSPDDPLFQSHVAVRFRWPYEADEVYVTGDWNDFKLTADHRLVPEERKNKEGAGVVFKLMLLLLPGVHRYKFYVNNSWEIDPKKPVTLGGMSNLLVVGSPTNVNLTRKITGDVASQEWDLIGWKLNAAWFISSVLKILSGCRAKLKTLKVTDMKSINGKLVAAVLQEQASPEDFYRQLTIAPELYVSCDAGEFVTQLFESMIQQGDRDNLQEFLFNNVRKTYSACPKCGYSGEMVATTSVFILNIVATASDKKLEQQVLDNLAPKEPCPRCASAICDVQISFENLPRFLLLNTGQYFTPDQLTPQLCLPNLMAGERHIYDLIGCNTTTANTAYQSLVRIAPGRWTNTVEDAVSDLPTWEHAVKRMCFGKANLLVFERSDVKRDRVITKAHVVDI